MKLMFEQEIFDHWSETLFSSHFIEEVDQAVRQQDYIFPSFIYSQSWNFLYHKSSSLDLYIRNRDETISSSDDNLLQIDQYTDDKVDKWCHHKISDNNLMSQSHRFSLKLSRITATLQRVDLDMKYFIFTNNTKCQYNRMCVSVFCPR